MKILNLIIPHYVEGFQIDWSKTIPMNYNDIAMYIHPRIAISFEKIWDIEKSCLFSIGHVIETGKDFDCDNFDERILDFKPFKNARVKRVFKGARKSIFFDEEEIEILAGIFSKEKFTAVVNIYIDGKTKELKDIPENIFKIILPILKHYNIVYPLDAEKYKDYQNTKKVKIIKRSKKKMDKKKATIKVITGLTLGIIGLAGTTVGIKNVIEGYEELTNKLKDVIFVEEQNK